MVRKLEERVKKYSDGIREHVDVILDRFKDYTDLIDDKLKHLSMMQDYDVEFQIHQKFSDLWNTINSEKFAYLSVEDKAGLDQNLRELRDKLTKIEMDQLDQKQFLLFFCKILHSVNQTFHKKEMCDAEVQVSLIGDVLPDVDKFEKAEANFMYHPPSIHIIATGSSSSRRTLPLNLNFVSRPTTRSWKDSQTGHSCGCR